ncbi:ROK family protein [Streptococcus sp. S784/96/1]|uniref:ROK family protein n=1 Tax=Streptococcus sp. S784/96/1 TaxID=2653499 RepID=UPI001387463E|nr:ROK family protein [Streptococcus sp. S784/96/1]
MVVACFDIGGTGVKSALISDDLQLRSYQEIATPDQLEMLLAHMDEVICQEGVTAISLSVPGAINYCDGTIGGLSAIPYIHGVSWYDLLETYHLPIYLENDANCVGLSALAERPTLKNCACVVVGTGIGGALILNGRLVRGARSYGGEFGYMMLKGMDFPLKNWSQLASTGSLVRRVQAHPKECYHSLDGKAIVALAEQGDLVCQTALGEMVDALCQGLLNLHYVIDPELIYIGGSISQSKAFIKRLVDRLQELQQLFPEDFPQIPHIKACHHTKHANLIGTYINTCQEKEHV